MRVALVSSVGQCGIAEHSAQLPVAREAARMVAVRVREEHVIDGQRRQRAFAHVEADAELRHLDIGGETRDRKADDGETLEIRCDYCNQEYRVAPAELRGLVATN